MAGRLSKERGDKYNAEMYSEINDIQLQFGKKLTLTAGIKHGDKVLDMGCGTGELTSFLAEKVGKESQVVGVDPDIERIKVATQKHSGFHENITFRHGDSSSQFLHCNKQNYDVHFSNFVFQWLNTQQKMTFINTAFNNLKPGGKIAIQTHEGDIEMIKEAADLFLNDPENEKKKIPAYFMEKSMTESLLRKAGFVLLSSEYFYQPYDFPTAEAFLDWLYASDYYDESRISSKKKKDFFNKIVNKDGTVTVYDDTIFQIVAKKID